MTFQTCGDSLTNDSALTAHSGPAKSDDSLTVDSALDALTAHSELSPSDDSDSLTSDSALDALILHSVPVIAGLDWERDGWRVSIAGEPAVRVSRDDLLTFDFTEVDTIIVEQAHMKERNVYSVAQVYTSEEIRSMSFRDKIRLFPGMPGQLAKAARAVGNIKFDEDGKPIMERIKGTDKFQTVPNKDLDAETMSTFAADNPARVQSWKGLLLADEDPSRRLWPARAELREDLREALNPLRTAWNSKGIAEKYALPEVVLFCTLLEEIYDDLSDGIKEQFGISRRKVLTKAGKPTAASAIANGLRVERMTPALTCFLAVYTREGDLRRNPKGGFIGIRFILDSIGMSSSYKPNMARSQLTHYGLRHYKGGRDGGFRSEYMKNLRQFLAIMRDAAGDSLTGDSALDVLTIHSVPGGQNLDSDSLTCDSALDALTTHSVPVLELQ